MGMDAKQKLLKKNVAGKTVLLEIIAMRREGRGVPAYSPGSQPLHWTPPDLNFCTAVPLGWYKGVPRCPAELRWHPELVDCLPTDGVNQSKDKAGRWGFVQVSLFVISWMSLFWPASLGQCLWTSFCAHVPEQHLLWAGCIIVMAGKTLFSSI